MRASPTGISRRSVRISTVTLLGEKRADDSTRREASGDLTECQKRAAWRTLGSRPEVPRLANPNLETLEVNVFTAEFAAHPQPVYRELVTKCPFARQALVGSPVLSRYEDVLWALRHPEIFSSEMEMHMALGTERPMIPQQIDPPAQTKFRKILDPRFSKKRMQEIAPAVRGHANQLIDAFIERGE